jgi:LPS-assembly lipoprotein
MKTLNSHSQYFIVIFATSCLLFLASCGFSPLYGTDGASKQISKNFENVYISNIPNSDGQYLRNLLIDRFYKNGRPVAPEYILTVSPIKEKRLNLDITKSADATRGQLRLDTIIRLKDQETGDILLKRDMHVVTSYNILNSQFTTHVAEGNAQQNALLELAQRIETQLALYFNRKQ